MNRRDLLLSSSAVMAAAALPALAIAQPSPADLSGRTLDGKSYDLRQDIGKVVLVFYWSTACAV